MILAILLATLFNTVSSASAPCSGTTYSVPFPYGATGATPDLQVTADGVVLPYSSGWTINKVNSASTGTITLTSACTTTVIVTRVTPRTQTKDFSTQSRLDLKTLTETLDRMEMQLQESVPAGGSGTLGSLSLTTPLPLTSGGSGASLGPCGSGFLTVVGTQMVCQVPSGLAAPGSTGVLLQAVTPGSVQTGHTNISGTVCVGCTSATVGGQISYSLGGTGFQITNPATLSGANAGIELRASSATLPAFARPFSFSSGTTGIMGYLGYGSATTTTRFEFGGTGKAELNSQNSAVPLTLQGGGSASNTDNVIIDNRGTNQTGGRLFNVMNNGASQASIATTGVVTSKGLTSTGPVSGTTGAFTGATSTGTLTIGTSGTAISKSVRGTLVTTPGTLVPCAFSGCNGVTFTITVTGAVAGADCIAGVLDPETITGIPIQCIARNNSCTIAVWNWSAYSTTLGSATYYCRVFNP